MKKSAVMTFKEFLYEINHVLMNDFVSMPNDEINRYMKMEKLLENKISRRFKVRRLESSDFGYLMEHLYGRDGIAYEDYEYSLPKRILRKKHLSSITTLSVPQGAWWKKNSVTYAWSMRIWKVMCPILRLMPL